MIRRGDATTPVVVTVAVVLVIIVVGLALFASMTHKARGPIVPAGPGALDAPGAAVGLNHAANRVAANNNLKQLALAASTADAVNGKLPPAFSKYGGATGSIADTALFVHLLPYIEEQAVYDAGVSTAAKATIRPLLANLDPSLPTRIQGHCSFAANLRVFAKCGSDVPAMNEVKVLGGAPDALTNRLSISRISSLDGTSNTAMFATRYAVCNGVNQNLTASPALPEGAFFGAAAFSVPPAPSVAGNVPAYLLSPSPANCSATTSFYAHSMADGPLSVGMCDGSVKAVSRRVSPTSWANLLCPNDGNVLGPDLFE